jgi:gamma-glutamylcyclotransferase (GGCT)/AIG2-like uncharacterized protein YtfP
MKYFAYGMNTNVGEMAHRCPDARSLGHARLPGYKFTFNRHADLMNMGDEYCDGVLWEITEDCLMALDALEGYPLYYTRFEVDVEWNGETVRAITYQMNPENQIPAIPSTSYYFMVTKGYAQHGVPNTQLIEAYVRAKEVDQYFVIS